MKENNEVFEAIDKIGVFKHPTFINIHKENSRLNYKIVSGSDKKKVQKEVSHFRNIGWSLYRELKITYLDEKILYTQALVLYNKSSEFIH